MKSEFTLALNQVATERGISPDDVIESIQAAIVAAFRKEYPGEYNETLSAIISKQTGETKVMYDGKDITPPGFGRIATQTARQVIFQKIREAEKKTVITHYKSQVDSIMRGRVIRFDGYNAYIDLGKTEGILPREEQIKNEHYDVNASLIFYIKEISEDKYGHSRIILSRTDKGLIRELFKREVPEIASGTVEIKNIVREPGERAKIAVYSTQSGVDPVGACVGQKGVRVQTVTDELGGTEKIDIIQWNKDVKLFITSALSPAKVKTVELAEDKHVATVTVDETQAPLAIGKSGINVNLASRLCDYEIDIKQTEAEQKAGAETSPETQPSDETPSESPKEEGANG
ncbi:transcription termination factor NusA [Candidatus Roizmanbacteria bacterium]|nr:transcription termination factor NusA [Candidatus Roizmanbacteria bacterium]